MRLSYWFIWFQRQPDRRPVASVCLIDRWRNVHQTGERVSDFQRWITWFYIHAVWWNRKIENFPGLRPYPHVDFISIVTSHLCREIKLVVSLAVVCCFTCPPIIWFKFKVRLSSSSIDLFLLLFIGAENEPVDSLWWRERENKSRRLKKRVICFSSPIIVRSNKWRWPK